MLVSPGFQPEGLGPFSHLILSDGFTWDQVALTQKWFISGCLMLFKPTFRGVGTGPHVIALGTGLVWVAPRPSGLLPNRIAQLNDIDEELTHEDGLDVGEILFPCWLQSVLNPAVGQQNLYGRILKGLHGVCVCSNA